MANDLQSALNLPPIDQIGFVVKDLSQAMKAYEPLFGPFTTCLLYTSPSPRDQRGCRMPSSA